MVIKTVVFDFDGTIANTKDLVVECTNEILQRHGYKPMTEADIEKFRALDLKEVLNRHLGVELYKIAPMLAEGWDLFYQKRKAGDIRPYDNILASLESLKKDKEVMVLSSNPSKNIEDIFEDWEFNFDRSKIHHANLLFGKHIEINRIIRDGGYEQRKKEILYVGDERRDVNACHKSGLGMVAVTWGFNNERAFQNMGFPQEYIVHTAKDMEDRIRSL